MAQRVRMDVAEVGTPGAAGGDEIVRRLTGQGLTSLGQEQPGQPIRSAGEVPLDGTELVPCDQLVQNRAREPLMT